MKKNFQRILSAIGLTALGLLTNGTAFGGNPLITQRYTADPH